MATCSPRRPSSARCWRRLHDLPIVGDVRGAGFFQAIELVKDKETKESFDDEEAEDLLRGYPLRRALQARPDLPR